MILRGKKKKKPHTLCFDFRHFRRSVSLEVESQLRQWLKLGKKVFVQEEFLHESERRIEKRKKKTTTTSKDMISSVQLEPNPTGKH